LARARALAVAISFGSLGLAPPLEAVEPVAGLAWTVVP
jgi:hypothetical protein